MAEEKSGDMLTSAKWAEKFGIPASKFKKAIDQLNIQPDMKKGVCGYYSAKTAEKVKEAVK